MTPASRRRSVAGAASSTLVIGAGLAVGLLAADMQHSWGAAEQARTASGQPALAGPAASVPQPRPVVVRTVITRTVTPAPVVVHRTVRAAARESAGSPALGAREPRRSRPPRSVGAHPGSATGTAGGRRSNRAAVAPAPAPRPAPAPAPPASTSMTS